MSETACGVTGLEPASSTLVGKFGLRGLAFLSPHFFICNLNIVKPTSKGRLAISSNGVPSTQLLKTKLKDHSWHPSFSTGYKASSPAVSVCLRSSPILPLLTIPAATTSSKPPSSLLSSCYKLFTLLPSMKLLACPLRHTLDRITHMLKSSSGFLLHWESDSNSNSSPQSSRSVVSPVCLFSILCAEFAISPLPAV